MGTDTASAKTKQELLTQHTLPKMEPMQTSKRKLMPVLLFHTELFRPSSASLHQSNPDTMLETLITRNTEGGKFNLPSHTDISGQLQITATANQAKDSTQVTTRGKPAHEESPLIANKVTGEEDLSPAYQRAADSS